MATDALSTATNTGNILSAFLPKKTNTTSSTATETSQTAVTAEGINDIIRQMMEGNTGLAALLQKQQGSGLYNSTTAQLLANDLAARVGEKAATASAATTKTATSTQSSPGTSIDPKWALGLQLLSEMLTPSKSSSGGSSGSSTDSWGTNFMNTLGSLGQGFSDIGTSMSDVFKKKDEELEYGSNLDSFYDSGASGINFDGFNLSGSASSPLIGLSNSGASYDPFSFSGSLLSSSFNTPSYTAPSSGFSLSGGSNGSAGINFGFSF